MNYGASVRPRRSLVESLNFESVTPFHGLATPSRTTVRRPPATRDENWVRGVTRFSPPPYMSSNVNRQQNGTVFGNSLNSVSDRLSGSRSIEVEEHCKPVEQHLVEDWRRRPRPSRLYSASEQNGLVSMYRYPDANYSSATD